MTNRCAPPDGSPSGWYWCEAPSVLKGEPNEEVVGRYYNGWWYFSGGQLSAETAYSLGYRYLRPARPDDAEARERLEAEATTMRHEIAQTSAIADHLMTENKRLREALDQTLATMQALHPSSAGDMSDGDYARLWNATMEVLEALNAR